MSANLTSQSPQYVATMIQGLAVCNVAASLVSNFSALQAQGCSTSSVQDISATFCTDETGLNALNLLNDTYQAITSGLDQSNIGWQGYM